MGVLLTAFKTAIIDALSATVSSNTSRYYAFTANGASNSALQNTSSSDYTLFLDNWQLLFGKLITNTDIVPVINNVTWIKNTVYTQYDNTRTDLSSQAFYVVTQPNIDGPYNVYKCIYNANGSPSTNVPDHVQSATFQKADGYMWRYVTTIPLVNYNTFATDNFIPIYTNTSISTTANLFSGVDVVVVTTGGNNYTAVTNGLVQSIVNSTLIQIQNNASAFNDTYALSGIYLTNNLASTSQLNYVSRYVANSLGNWIVLGQPANTTNIVPAITAYNISPRVVFSSDAASLPQAFTVVNTVTSSVSSVTVIDPGYGINWANVAIVANSVYGNGAAAYAVVPPLGGHGKDPSVELFTRGLGIALNFSNTEANTIPTNVTYNTVGIIRNPFTLLSNGSMGTPYTNTVFSQVLKANVSPPTTYTVNTVITGAVSRAVGTVVFSNSSSLWLTGDKKFANGEYVTDGTSSTVITINTLGSVFTDNQQALYVQNVPTVSRSNTQSEDYRLVILL